RATGGLRRSRPVAVWWNVGCVSQFDEPESQRRNRSVLSVLPTVHSTERHLKFSGELLLSDMATLADFADQSRDIYNGHLRSLRWHLASLCIELLYEIV